MRRLWGLLFALLCAALITAGVGLPAAAEEGEPGPPSDVASATPGPTESPEPVQTPDPPKAEPAESTPAAPDDERDEEPTPPTESRPQPSEPPSQSRTGTQSVAVTLTATTAGSTGVGWVANVWGTATGAPNSEVWTEVRLSDGRWSRSQIRTSDASGWYVIPLTYGQHSAGTQTFRVGVRSTDGVVYSANVTLTRVAISASTAGAAPVGAGANVWGTATGAPNAEVWTEVRLSDGRWSRSQIRTSNASGWYAIPLTYGQNSAGTQTFRVGTRTGAGVVYSSPVSLTRVSVSATTAGSRPVGVTTYVWGTAGGAPNSPVRTEVLIGGRWSRSQVGTTSATGYYALPLTYGQNNAGTYTYRVVVTVHGRDIASPSVLLTRTGSPSPVIPDSQYNMYRGPNITSRVILTYDDCPTSLSAFKSTVLAAEQADVGLALFPTGDCLLSGRFDAAFARAHGHHVFNHSITHPNLTTLSYSAVQRELGAPGVVTSYGRPPYGAHNATVRAAYQSVGMRVWLWNVDTNDWRGRTQAQVVNQVVSETQPGQTVLMHMQWNAFNGSAISQMKSGLNRRGIQVCRNHVGTVPVRPSGMWC